MPNAGIGPSQEKMASGREFIPDRSQAMIHADITVLSSTTSSLAPSTTIPKGTAMGKITATGKYTAYSDSNSDGSQTARCLLDPVEGDLDMLNYNTALAEDKTARALFFGRVTQTACTGLDDNGITDLITLSNGCAILFA